MQKQNRSLCLDYCLNLNPNSSNEITLTESLIETNYKKFNL